MLRWFKKKDDLAEIVANKESEVRKENVYGMLSEYHKCVKYFNKCGRMLANEFTKQGLQLSYANSWIHKDGDRVGILFYDSKKDKERYISVPISVFIESDYAGFVRKYCKLDDK